jgi:tRNA modification GTPase
VAARSRTATGEDSAELHLHGGRAVVAAVLAALAALPGLRQALPGEFTRRAFANGRIDLAEAEGLADLLTAETELQRRAALAMADGALSRLVAGWRDKVLALSARLEAALDFSDEDDVGADLPAGFAADAGALADDLARGSPGRARSLCARATGSSSPVRPMPESPRCSTPWSTTRPRSRRPSRDHARCSGPRGGDRWRALHVHRYGRPARRRRRRDRTDRHRPRWRRPRKRIWCCGWGQEGAGPAGRPLWEIETRIDRPDRAIKHGARFALSARTGRAWRFAPGWWIMRARRCPLRAKRR